MSEVEFDRLLDAVRTAIAPVPHADFSSLPLVFDGPPLAANDKRAGLAVRRLPRRLVRVLLIPTRCLSGCLKKLPKSD